MSSCLEYYVPGNSYTITNGTAKEQREARALGCGSGFARCPGIRITSYKGKSLEKCYPIPHVRGIKAVWKDLLKDKPTEEWKLTSISISDTSADFYLDPIKSKEELDYLTIYAEKDMEIWLEVPRDDEMPPVKYLIDTYYDYSRSKEKYGFFLRVTEFYERMERQISFSPDEKSDIIGDSGCYGYIHIAEYRD